MLYEVITNFIGIYNRTNPDGFKWLVHDMEKSMYYSSDNTYINGLDASWYSQQFSAFNPLTIHRALLSNNEYRLKFSDRVYKFFSEGGLFTPETVAAMLEKRKEQIYNPVIAEAARWSWWVTSGSDLSNVPTRADWEQNVNHRITSYNVCYTKLLRLAKIHIDRPPGFVNHHCHFRAVKTTIVAGGTNSAVKTAVGLFLGRVVIQG